MIPPHLPHANADHEWSEAPLVEEASEETVAPALAGQTGIQWQALVAAPTLPDANDP